MGMFDYVNFRMECPKCGVMTSDFQSKDDDCNMETIEPDGLMCFYALCSCETWLQFARPRPSGHPRRETPLTREQVEAMGFVLSVEPPVAS